ncbi:MAG: hypothetical protein AAE985_01165 [Thermoplasmataceae archaeon]
MNKLKLSYEFGFAGGIFLIIIAVLELVLSSISKYLKIFGTFPSAGAVPLIIFALIALLGTEFSRRDKKIGYTSMIVIAIAGMITFVNIEIAGFVLILMGGILVMMNK